MFVGEIMLLENECDMKEYMDNMWSQPCDAVGKKTSFVSSVRTLQKAL